MQNWFQTFQLIENKNEWIEGRKEKSGRKTDSKYHQLVEKCNSLHVSISCVVKLTDLN